MRSIDTKITIDAPCHIIWDHLTHFSKYGEWNSFITSITGEAKKGSRLEVNFHPPGGKSMQFKPTILHFEPGRTLRWLGSIGLKGIFDGEHIFTCEVVDENKTVFTQSENFSGILVPVLWGSMHEKTRKGFELMNQQLKERSEKDAWGRKR